MRRYLLREEISEQVYRKKTVECFLGACKREGKPGIKWLSVSQTKDGVQLSIYETADLGSEDMLDLYEFGPLDPSLEADEADEEVNFGQLEECFAYLETRFPGAADKFVNQGIIQEEYKDFIQRGRE